MVGRLTELVFLTLVWVTLWGEATPANIISGLLVGLALMTLFPFVTTGPKLVFRPLRALRFLIYFLYKLVEASFVVAWEVVSPGDELHEGIVAVPITGASEAVITIIAFATTLTPGTITLEVRRTPPTLYMHVLHLQSVDDTLRDTLKLERLALEAFGTAEAIENARRTREQLLARHHQRKRS